MSKHFLSSVVVMDSVVAMFMDVAACITCITSSEQRSLEMRHVDAYPLTHHSAFKQSMKGCQTDVSG